MSNGAYRRPELPSDDRFVAEWSQRLRESIGQHDRLYRAHVAQAAALIGLGLVALAVWAFSPTLAALYAFFAACAGAMTIRGYGRQAAAARISAVSTLLEAEDPRLIGLVAQHCYHSDNSLSLAARRSLRRALPLVHQWHRTCFDDPGLAALIRLLTDPDPAMVAAVLGALERLREVRARFAVARIARADADMLPMQWPADARREVHDAATRCSATLDRAAAEAHSRRLLLRPADRPSDAQTLLRPAQGRDSDPRFLLRPTDSDEQ